MGNDINYAAVLADIDARISKLQATREGIVDLMALSGTSPSGGPGGLSPTGKPAHDAFIGMSIPDAAKKHLASARKKLSTQDLMAAFTEGGLPESKYNTVYAILRRREKQVGDVINMKGDWALSEWYPNHRPKSKAAKGESEAPELSDEEIAELVKESNQVVDEINLGTKKVS